MMAKPGKPGAGMDELREKLRILAETLSHINFSVGGGAYFSAGELLKFKDGSWFDFESTLDRFWDRLMEQYMDTVASLLEAMFKEHYVNPFKPPGEEMRKMHEEAWFEDTDWGIEGCHNLGIVRVIDNGRVKNALIRTRSSLSTPSKIELEAELAEKTSQPQEKPAQTETH